MSHTSCISIEVLILGIVVSWRKYSYPHNYTKYCGFVNFQGKQFMLTTLTKTSLTGKNAVILMNDHFASQKDCVILLNVVYCLLIHHYTACSIGLF